MYRPYKSYLTFSERLNESTNIKKKYPDRIPVIIQRTPYSNAPLLSKYKYLVPTELTVAQLLYSIRKKIKIESHQSIFFFIGETIPISSSTILQLYNIHKDSDGFLYLTYDTENTFG